VDRQIFVSMGLQGLLVLLLMRQDRVDEKNQFFLRRPWKLRDAVLGIVVFDSIYLLIYLLYLHFDAFRRFSNGNVYLFYLPLVLLVFMLCKARCNRGFADLGFRSDRGANLVLLSIVIGSLSFLTAWTVMSVPLIGHSGDWGLVRKCVNYAQWAFGTSVVGPIGEEGFARGIIYTLFRKKYTKPWALIFASIFFAAMHPLSLDISLFVIHFGYGLLYAFVYERTQSLTTAAGVHGLINLFINNFMTGVKFLQSL
jgi:membrane protease YdiL (CAAX protease family)